MTAAELLEKAQATYYHGSRAYRDTLLETGRLLHEFVVARLREGDGVSPKKRIEAGITHEGCIKEAVRALKANTERIRKYIGTSQVVSLLSEGGEVGSLSFESLAHFRVLIKRNCGINDSIKSPGCNSAAPVSEASKWIIRKEVIDVAASLFQKAVKEGWNRQKAYDETRQAVSRSNDGRLNPRKLNFGNRVIPDRLLVQPTAPVELAKASPKDAAEALFKVVEKSPVSWQVAQHLMDMLRTIRETKVDRVAELLGRTDD